jgi:hypothetical protein
MSDQGSEGLFSREACYSYGKIFAIAGHSSGPYQYIQMYVGALYPWVINFLGLFHNTFQVLRLYSVE